MRLLKKFLIFMLFFQAMTLCFIIAQVYLFYFYDEDRFSVLDSSVFKSDVNQYVFYVNNVDIDREDLYLRVVGAPNDLRLVRARGSDRGSINSQIICDGKVTARETVRLDGHSYRLRYNSISVPLMSNVVALNCDIEISLNSQDFSEYISAMTVVRTKKGEIFGVDRRFSFIFLILMLFGSFLSALYILPFHGLPMHIGFALTLILAVSYFHLKKREKPQKLLNSSASWFKKLLKWSAVLLVLFLLALVLYESKFWRYDTYQFVQGFYFEKYRTAEAAEQALNSLYPPGTPLSKVEAGLKRAGGWVPSGVDKQSPDIYLYQASQDGKAHGNPWVVKVYYQMPEQKVETLEVILSLSHL